MCDSDVSSVMDPTGFIFGDPDNSNELEDDDLLDAESKQLLSSLSRMGLGSIVSEVLEETKAAREEEDVDYSQKSPSAIDFFDIEDLADDFCDIDITNGKAQDKLETVAAGDVKKEEPLGDCPQPEVVTTSSGDSECKERPQNEEHMEGDGELMPPPATVPLNKSKKGDRGSKRQATPPDAMLPSKYANVDVT